MACGKSTDFSCVYFELLVSAGTRPAVQFAVYASM